MILISWRTKLNTGHNWVRTCLDKSKIDAIKSSCQNILSRITLVMIFLGYEVISGMRWCWEMSGSDVLKSSCQNKLLINEWNQTLQFMTTNFYLALKQLGKIVMFVEIWTIEDLMIYADLECLLFEISIPDRHLGSTPNFPPEPFNEWALECDWQNCRWKKELYLLVAVNCNLLSEANVHVYLFVSCILNIYGLYELITEPRGALWANVDLYSYPNGILEKCSLLAVFYFCVNRSILQEHCW